MSTYKRLPRGKQKPHDEFVDWTMHALIWIKQNWQTAVEIVIVAGVALGIWMGASAYWQYRSNAAAQGLYAAGKLEAGSDAQLKKLEDVVSRYARTPAGQSAMMQLGDLYLSKKEFDKAIEEFRRLSGKSRHHPILMIAALHKLAQAFEAKGDLKMAAETYLKAAANPGNLVSLVSRFHAADCLEKDGNANEASALYRQIISEAKDDDRAVREASEERLIWLIANNRIEG